MVKVKTQMTITYHNGTTQVVKPDMVQFDGEWSRLAQQIAGVTGYEKIKIS